MAALKERRAGGPAPGIESRSPEILVPASSSPMRAQPQGFFRNVATGIPSGLTARPNPNNGIDPPSKRLKLSRDPSEASSVPSPGATPSPPSRPTSTVPLSRNGSGDHLRSNLSHLHVDSEPQSPADTGFSDFSSPVQPHRKIKPRYGPGESPLSTPDVTRSPLVAAAAGSIENPAFLTEVAARLQSQYRAVPINIVQLFLNRYQNQMPLAITEIKKYHDAILAKQMQASTSQAAARQKPVNTSTIYANRGKRRDKRVIRDPDDESDASGAFSEEESDGGWSGDENKARRRKRVYNDAGDEIDAEAEAVTVFNTADVDTFTGAMGTLFQWHR